MPSDKLRGTIDGTDSSRFRSLDRLSPSQIVRLMNREDRKVLVAIDEARPRIARAIGLISNAFRQGGRLVFVGAGTSGRLGVLEAAECPQPLTRSLARCWPLWQEEKQAVF